MLPYIFILLIFLILFTIIILYFLNNTNDTISKDKADSPKPKIPCMLCGSLLQRGERLKSEQYNTKNDNIVKVYGCPYCYGEKAVNIRKCPICGKILKSDEILIGRMFERSNGKKHLHINGCSYCRFK